MVSGSHGMRQEDFLVSSHLRMIKNTDLKLSGLIMEIKKVNLIGNMEFMTGNKLFGM